MFQTLGFPAGGRQIDAKGNFFRYESCRAAGLDETIRVRADGNDLGTFLPGDYVDLGSLTATRWMIAPATPSATGVVRVGNGSVGSSRLTGNVRVIDQSAEKTLAGQQFWNSATAAANAGAVSLLALFPAGIVCALRGLIVMSTVAGEIHIGRGTGLGTATPAGSPMANKRVGGAASTAYLTAGNCAAATPTGAEVPGWSMMGRIYIQANTPTPVPFATPWVLDGRSGTPLLTISGGVLNRDVLAVFDVEQL